MNEFWNGLKHSSAFCFTFDEQGKPVDVEKTDYILYQGTIFPFDIFGDELWSLNDYCYGIVKLLEQEEEKCLERRKRIESGAYANTYGFTDYEWFSSIASEEYKREWIADVMIPHLIILLYSFLEKTMNHIYKLFEEEGRISFRPKGKIPYLYRYLCSILGKSVEEFHEEYSDLYDILDQCRIIRNNFAHDNLEGVVMEGKRDYAYETRKLSLTFRLIDFISVITLLIYETEKIYKRGN